MHTWRFGFEWSKFKTFGSGVLAGTARAVRLTAVELPCTSPWPRLHERGFKSTRIRIRVQK